MRGAAGEAKSATVSGPEFGPDSGRTALAPDAARRGRSFGLRSRLLLLVVFILTLAAGTTAVFLAAQNSVEQALDKIVGADVPRLNLAVQLSSQVQTLVARVPALSRSVSGAARASAHTQIGQELLDIHATLEALRHSGADAAVITTLEGYLTDIRSNTRQLDAIVSRRINLEEALAEALKQLEQARTSLSAALQDPARRGNPARWQLMGYDLIASTTAGIQLTTPQQLQAVIEKIDRQSELMQAEPTGPGHAGPAMARLRSDIAAATAGANSALHTRLNIVRLNYLQETRLSVNGALSDRFVSAVSQFGVETQTGVAATSRQLRHQLQRHQIVSMVTFAAILGGVALLVAYVSYFVVRRLVLIRNNIQSYLSDEKPPPIPAFGSDEIGEIANALNFFVKLIAERELALGAAKDAAELALANLRDTQSLLVQSEKMAVLGQLVANVAHEINTPIGAVKSSGRNIADALAQALSGMPQLFQILDQQHRTLFVQMIDRIDHSAAILSTREERAMTRAATRELEAAGIAEPQRKAGMLVQMQLGAALADCLPLLRHPECGLILDTAYSVFSISSNTRNINTAVDRVAKIIFALKSFSRTSQNEQTVEVNLCDGIETVLTIYQSQIKQNATLVRQYDEIPPLHCLPDELNQVWTNLIHNALQAMQPGGTLTVGLKRVGDDALVTVGDSGSGIPDAIRDRIFDAFFTTKPVGEGSGLGLDIVKKIVQKHRGRIEVQSQVGVGTTFLVYLPYSRSA